MKKNIINVKNLAFTVLSLGVVSGALLLAPEASAQIETGLNAAGANMDQGAEVDGIVGNVVNVFLYIVGAVAVIMVIFGGFQYMTSAGDPSKASKGRNTVVYAIVGLLLAVFAYAIINYVLDEIAG